MHVDERQQFLTVSGVKKYFFQADLHQDKKTSSQIFSFVGLTHRISAPFTFSSASVFESRFVSNGSYVHLVQWFKCLSFLFF